ncbi:hypothetical protein J6590_039976 [Homalodisca vitripennis]|nr:hypothetical protein J6590_039976 [Homalodisca vitripennis]
MLNPSLGDSGHDYRCDSSFAGTTTLTLGTVTIVASRGPKLTVEPGLDYETNTRDSRGCSFKRSVTHSRGVETRQFVQQCSVNNSSTQTCE